MPIFNPKMSLSDIHNNLNLSNELRIFCRFHKVPDASQFSKFRTNYHANLADMFRNLVDITEPICRKINEKKAKYPTTILQALNFLSRKTTLNSLKLNLMRLKNFPAPKRTALIPAPMPLPIPDSLIPPLPTLRPDSSISTDTSVMPSSLESLPMDWVFQDSFPSLMKILNQHILKQLLKKLIILMSTRKSLMQSP